MWRLEAWLGHREFIAAPSLPPFCSPPLFSTPSRSSTQVAPYSGSVRDTSTSAAERWVPAPSCLSLHQCFCLQRHGSDSLIQTLMACLLIASLRVRSAPLRSSCNAGKMSNLSSYRFRVPALALHAQRQSDLNSQSTP